MGRVFDEPGWAVTIGPYLGVAFDGFVMGHGVSWMSLVITTTLAAGMSTVVDVVSSVVRVRRLRQS